MSYARRGSDAACWLTIQVALLAGCNADVAPAPQLGLHTQAIVGGEVDDLDLGVVGLVAASGRIYCTGTLVAPRIVTTAAHCLHGHAPSAVFFGAASHLGGRMRAIAQWQVDPSYEVGKPTHDIGAIELAEDAPSDVTAWRILSAQAAATALHEGAELRIVGFGSDSAGSGPVAIKRQGATRIDQLDKATFTHRAEPARACFGDSGGPAFVSVAGEEYLAGVVSGGDGDCSEVSVQTRLDAHAEDFLEHFPTPSAVFGQRCYDENNCSEGSCILPLERDAFSYCSNVCTTTEDCGPGTTCTMDHDGMTLCRYPEPSPGALGAACAEVSECASALCARAVDADHQVCALRCFPENPIECPAGFRCVGEHAVKGRSICIAEPSDDAGVTPKAPEGAASHASCSAAFGHSGAVPTWSALLLLWPWVLGAARARHAKARARSRLRGR